MQNSCFCPKCKSNANVPIGYETVDIKKYKRCKKCGKLNQATRSVCQYCGSYPLYKLKNTSEISHAESVYFNGIQKFSSGNYGNAFNDFKVSAHVYHLEWALLALAECYRYGYGIQADIEKGIDCLKKCNSAEARKKIELFRKDRRNRVAQKHIPPHTERSDAKQKTIPVTKKKEKSPLQGSIACSQVVKNHPLLKESPVMRRAYLCMLKSIVDKIDSNSRYTQAVLKLYEKTFDAYAYRSACDFQPSSKLKNFLLFDILVLIGYDQKKLDAKSVKTILCYLNGGTQRKKSVEKLLLDFSCSNPAWESVLSDKLFADYLDWIDMIRVNINFMQKRPYRILVTATMSAGKSTFINALSGKKIAKALNEACTGRIHYIYSKPFEDGLIGKWEKGHFPVLDGADCILCEDEAENEILSYEAAYFSSGLGGHRFVILDTPGVNSAEHKNHGEITQNIIRDGHFDLMIYVINYTVESTEDNAKYLKTVRELISDDKTVLFVLNKVDTHDSDDVPLYLKIQQISKELKKIGFEKPQVLPLSAASAFFSSEIADKYNLSNPEDFMKLSMDAHAMKKFAMLNGLVQKEELHLEKYYKLLKTDEKAICKRLSDAMISGNILEQAAVHSGMYSLVSVIKKYITQ